MVEAGRACEGIGTRASGRLDRGRNPGPHEVANLESTPVFVRLTSSLETLITMKNPNSDKPTASVSEKSFTSKTTGAKLLLIPAGEFQMGSPNSVYGCHSEKPQHEVRLTNPFYLSETVVTQSQWKAVMGTTPWKDQSYVNEGSDYPATYVNWENAQEFYQKLSEKDGREYRLPTEAEWEYACRGGTTTTFSFGDSVDALWDYAWWGIRNRDRNMESEQYPHEVGKKRANPFGLFDMHGNVWEWCSDWFWADYYKPNLSVDPKGPEEGSVRALRGGSWHDLPGYCRSAARRAEEPSFRCDDLGFRVALSSGE